MNETRRDYHAAERAIADKCPRCLEAREKIRATGYTLSSVPDHSDTLCQAQSIEHCGPATFGHPRAFAQVRASIPSPFAGDGYCSQCGEKVSGEGVTMCLECYSDEREASNR